MNSRPVKRIEDVMMLRTSQFTEDAGPMAHPIRPDAYIKVRDLHAAVSRAPPARRPAPRKRASRRRSPACACFCALGRREGRLAARRHEASAARAPTRLGT